MLLFLKIINLAADKDNLQKYPSDSLIENEILSS